MVFLECNNRLKGAILVLMFRKRIGKGAKRVVVGLFFNFGPVAGQKWMLRMWFGIDKGRQIPAFLIAELRVFIRCAKRHIGFDITGKTGEAEEAGGLVVAARTPKWRVVIAGAVGHGQSLAISAMAGGAFARIKGFSFGGVGGAVEWFYF